MPESFHTHRNLYRLAAGVLVLVASCTSTEPTTEKLDRRNPGTLPSDDEMFMNLLYYVPEQASQRA